MIRIFEIPDAEIAKAKIKAMHFFKNPVGVTLYKIIADYISTTEGIGLPEDVSDASIEKMFSILASKNTVNPVYSVLLKEAVEKFRSNIIDILDANIIIDVRLRDSEPVTTEYDHDVLIVVKYRNEAIINTIIKELVNVNMEFKVSIFPIVVNEDHFNRSYEEGRMEANNEVAKTCLAKGMSLDEIAKITELLKEDILLLSKEGEI